MNYQQLLPCQKLLTARCLRLWIASHFHSHSLSHPLYAEWLGLTWWLKHIKKNILFTDLVDCILISFMDLNNIINPNPNQFKNARMHR